MWCLYPCLFHEIINGREDKSSLLFCPDLVDSVLSPTHSAILSILDHLHHRWHHFFFYIFIYFLTSASLIVTPFRVCWRDWVDVTIFFMWEKNKPNRHPEWLSSRKLSERGFNFCVISFDFVFISTKTQHFVTQTIPHVWPRDDRCCSSVAYSAVSCVTAYHVNYGMWCDTELIQWLQR